MDEPTGQPEPFTKLQEMAVQMHELFSAYMGAGFSCAEAFELVRTALAATLRGPTPSED